VGKATAGSQWRRPVIATTWRWRRKHWSRECPWRRE